MLHANRVKHAELLVLGDLLLLGLAAWGARGIAYSLTEISFPLWLDALFAFSTGVAWTIFSAKLHLYDNKRTESLPSEALSALVTFFMAMAVGVLVSVLLFDFNYRRIFYCAFAVTGLSLVVLGRFILCSGLRKVRKSAKERRRILIVGRNPGVYALIESLLDHPHFGVEVVGVVDVPARFGRTHPIAGKPLPRGVRELGTTDDLERVFPTAVVDEVLVLLPMRSFYTQIEGILQTCEQVGVVTKMLPDLFNVNIARRTTSWVGDVPFITYFTGPKENIELGIKRVADLIMAGAALVALSPFLVALAAWIKISSPGPIFFRQLRAGLNGRPFEMLKFRSMYIDAEERKKELAHLNEMDGPVFKMKNDPRITRVGSFIRKFSLDELPQLFNILKGEMSVVGPRPPVPEEVKEYAWWQRRRLSFRPGLTCIWQVSGRNEIEFGEWMEMDLSYIDNWSLALDFSLILRTIPVVITGKGAS